MISLKLFDAEFILYGFQAYKWFLKTVQACLVSNWFFIFKTRPLRQNIFVTFLYYLKIKEFLIQTI